METLISIFLSQFFLATSALLTIGELNVLGVRPEALLRHKYIHDHSQSVAIINDVVDFPTSNKVCPDYEGVPGAKGGLKITASPGMPIKVWYLKEQLPKFKNAERGIITWYGLSGALSPNFATFDTIEGFQRGEEGEILASSNHNNSYFRLPSYLTPGDLYTLYWVWNTTYPLNGGFLVFTSCISVYIIDNATLTGPFNDFRLKPRGENMTSSFTNPERLAISHEKRQTNYPSPNGPITLYAWPKPNCEGERAQTQFDFVTFTKNNSNFYPSRSFKLSRPLEGQEQLDLSLAINLTSWNSTKSLALKSPNPACDSFERTYFAWNGSADCHNTPAFTCHRLWINPGLPL